MGLVQSNTVTAGREDGWQAMQQLPPQQDVLSVRTKTMPPSTRNLQPWDHGNAGAIIPSSSSNPQQMLGSSYNDPSIEVWTNIYLVCCAHSSSNNMPELIGGRMPSELLTFEGKRQAKAVGHYFLYRGLQFDAIFTSPLERSKQTAFHVCQVYIHMLFFYFPLAFNRFKA